MGVAAGLRQVSVLPGAAAHPCACWIWIALGAGQHIPVPELLGKASGPGVLNCSSALLLAETTEMSH